MEIWFFDSKSKRKLELLKVKFVGFDNRKFHLDEETFPSVAFQSRWLPWKGMKKVFSISMYTNCGYIDSYHRFTHALYFRLENCICMPYHAMPSHSVPLRSHTLPYVVILLNSRFSFGKLVDTFSTPQMPLLCVYTTTQRTMNLSIYRQLFGRLLEISIKIILFTWTNYRLFSCVFKQCISSFFFSFLNFFLANSLGARTWIPFVYLG